MSDTAAEKREKALQIKHKAQELNDLLHQAARLGLHAEIDLLPMQIITVSGAMPKVINVCIYDKL